MKTLHAYGISQDDRRSSVRGCAWLFLTLVAFAGCADVGDDTSDDAGRVDVDYGGRAGSTNTTTGMAGAAGSSGASGGTGGQGGSSSPPDAGNTVDASVDSSIGDAGSLSDAPTRVDGRTDTSVIDVRSDAPVTVDAPVILEAEAGPRCGNGVIDPGEECDDGNTLDLDSCTSICTDNRPCRECEENNCPRDPARCMDPIDGCSAQPSCADYPKPEDQALCYAVFACVVRTGCAIQGGATFCFCGTTPDQVTACKEAKIEDLKGPCTQEIFKAFKPLPAPTTTVDSSAIVNGMTDVSSPHGGAMSYANCDYLACGKPEYGGNNECSTTLHPKVPEGGVDSGTLDGTASDNASTSDAIVEAGNPG